MTTALAADGVFQGGGIKGLAIAGALLEFESHGRLKVERWVNVAGTSAGAIIAAYVAAGHSAQELTDLIDRAPFASFQDWGPPGGRFFGGGLNLLRRRGLARGEVFRKWFDSELGGMTFRDVANGPNEDGSAPTHPYRLRMIAADVTNHRLLVLPDDLHRYRLPGSARTMGQRGPLAHRVIDADGFRIADAVRMSLSIPYFFEPVELVDAGTGMSATIVDGGTVSNFPIWLFDTDREVLRRPTFGLRLIGGRPIGSGLKTFVRMLGWAAALAADINQTQSSSWDERFVSQSTRVRTCTVDAGDVATTDFELSRERRNDLLYGGRRAARGFLDSYDLEAYVNTFGRRLELGAHV